MKKLKTVDADTLLYQPLDKPSFIVDGLIPTGLSLFCGAQKIGKSWLMLKLCLCVSEGKSLRELPATPGDVLYLCLEDTFYRIQDCGQQYPAGEYSPIRAGLCLQNEIGRHEAAGLPHRPNIKHPSRKKGADDGKDYL